MRTYIVFPGSPQSKVEQDDEKAVGDQVTDPGQSNISTRELLSNFRIGARVIRGPDWKWGDQVTLYPRLILGLTL